jgi:GTP-binding protein HflX
VLVVNKADIADPVVVARLLGREPHAVVVSAATGTGLEDLLAAIEVDLPSPTESVDALLPYDRGDLVARIHEEGRDVAVEYTSDGAHVRATVGEQLAAEVAGASAAGSGADDLAGAGESE